MRIKLTLENKFIALAAVLILLGSVLMNTWIVTLYHDQLMSEAEKKALLLAESTAISFTNTLLYEELELVEEGGLLENNIYDLISDSVSAVIGMTVYDKDGVVLASDDYKRYLQRPESKVLAVWNSLTEAHLIRAVDGMTFEIITPLHISTKRFGTLSMEFTLAEEHAILAAFRHKMLMVIIGMAITGLLIAFLVARTLAKPIKRLAGEMRKVRDPAFVAPLLRTRRQDEIGDLERGFVDMLDRLKAAAVEKERQQHALIQAEKLASVGTLVSGLAHEINNPLAGMRTCLRRIMKRPEHATQTRKYAQLMDEALLRIEKIVQDLLDFSRKKELILQRTDLNKIIRAACSLVDYRLKNQKVKLRQRLARNLAQIQGAPLHLEQVFVNLLLN
ncbi:MAG: histidine kinase dimerization/phospho-acceptor domain-containing protein, partial [bacterium]